MSVGDRFQHAHIPAQLHVTMARHAHCAQSFVRSSAVTLDVEKNVKNHVLLVPNLAHRGAPITAFVGCRARCLAIYYHAQGDAQSLWSAGTSVLRFVGSHARQLSIVKLVLRWRRKRKWSITLNV